MISISDSQHIHWMISRETVPPMPGEMGCGELRVF
jgi:hypothetical protein